MSATPLTVTFMAIGCGLAKSLLGSTSAISVRAPTLMLRSSLMPVAVRSRRSYRPRRQSGASFTVALTWASLTTASFVTVIPG